MRTFDAAETEWLLTWTSSALSDPHTERIPKAVRGGNTPALDQTLPNVASTDSTRAPDVGALRNTQFVKKFIRSTALFAAVIAWLMTSVESPADADPVVTTAIVLRVVDGDTVDIVDDVRGRLRVRLLGIDTPETKKPGYTVGCWGPEATHFAETSLTGQRMAMITDPAQDLHDRYGRTLAYLIKADGWNYSVEAARAGAAKSYVYQHKPVSEHPAIAAAEQEAIAANRGLWGAPCFGTTDSIPR